MQFRFVAATLFALIIVLLSVISVAAAERVSGHTLSVFAKPKYAESFSHFDYVNPNAPQGDRIRLGVMGSFDSLHPFIMKGTAAAGLDYTYATLMVPSRDEIAVYYGYVAERVTYASDKSWVIFQLRPQAQFHDGSAMTADDVVATYDHLKKDGVPAFRSLLKLVKSVRVLDAHRVRFDFTEAHNNELMLLVAGLPVLSKADLAQRDFAQTSMQPWLGSGPYKVGTVSAGAKIVYEKVDDFWGRNLPVMRGHHHFNQIEVEYYRDDSVMMEAFKSGRVDVRIENISRNWMKAYHFPAVKDGRVVRDLIEHQLPSGMQGFWMNTRRPLLNNRRVREALILAFDFEWANKNLYFNLFRRTTSFFANTPYAAVGLPTGREREILSRFQAQLPPEVMTQPVSVPSTDGSGFDRNNLLRAQQLLQAEGFVVQDNVLYDPGGQPVVIELLMNDPVMQRLALPYARSLKRLGIQLKIRALDAAQMYKRMERFDFDMAIEVVPQSLSPGLEQKQMWTSESRDLAGSMNYAGVNDPIVDALVDMIVRAPSQDELEARTKALDRVLMWGHYVVPHMHSRNFRVAYWQHLQRPEKMPAYSLGIPDIWWSKRAERMQP